MEPTKAIEILKLGFPDDIWWLKPEVKDAIMLGIEALKEKLEREKEKQKWN